MHVASIHDSIAGYCYAQRRPYQQTTLTFPYLALHIHHICVAEEYRRRGIGSALIDAARTTAQKIGAERLTADVWDFNEDAKRTFQSSGLSSFQ